MKPEHFIYKPDGLYYIPNMPDSSKYYSTETYPGDTFDQDSYNEAIERAKEEAVKCDIKLEGQAVANAMFHGVTKSEKDWIEGEIYTINIEEEIEAAYQCLVHTEWRDILEDEYKSCIEMDYCVRKIARIAVPKKEPDHECIMNLMTDVCVYSCECGKIEVASNISYHDKPKTYIPESAPKKEEETQEQILSELLNEFHLWCIGISFDQEGDDNKTRDEFIKDKLKAIEIKRKPL